MKKILLAVLLALPNLSQAADLSSVAVTHVENGAGGSLNLVVGGKHLSLDCEKTWQWKDLGHYSMINLTGEDGAPAKKYDGIRTFNLKAPESGEEIGVGTTCQKVLEDLQDQMSHADGVAMYIGFDNGPFGVRPAFFLNTKYAKSIEDLHKTEEAFASSDSH